MKYMGWTAKPTKKSLIDSNNRSVLEVLFRRSLFINMAVHTKPLAIKATTRRIPFQIVTVTDIAVKAVVFFIS